MTEMRHVFVEVGRRRWCMCCDLFQTARKDGTFMNPGICHNGALAAESNRMHMSALTREPKAQEGNQS